MPGICTLTKTFKTLLPEVKRALHTVLSPRAVNLPLHLRDGIWQADIHDTELLQSATFVLAVAANMPVDQIQRQFIQQSKISSPEKIVIQRQGAVGMAIADTAKRERNIGAHIFCTAHNARRQLTQRQCSRVTFF